MSAYLIFDITIHDPEKYEEYKKLTPEVVAAYDGKFIVRGGQTEAIEGTWAPKRVVILEFPSAARAKEWWGSELYTKARIIRQSAATTEMILVEGA